MMQPVVAFVRRHQDHVLIVADDVGKQPWDIGEPGWEASFAVPSKFAFSCALLPQNLVQQFGCRSWDEAIRTFQAHAQRMLDPQPEIREGIDLLKKGFQALIARTP
jgi:hypothetical protein